MSICSSPSACGTVRTAPVLDWYRNNGGKLFVVNAVGAVDDITTRALSALRG
jgi:hypothetical protein